MTRRQIASRLVFNERATRMQRVGTINSLINGRQQRRRTRNQPTCLCDHPCLKATVSSALSRPDGGATQESKVARARYSMGAQFSLIGLECHRTPLKKISCLSGSKTPL